MTLIAEKTAPKKKLEILWIVYAAMWIKSVTYESVDWSWFHFYVSILVISLLEIFCLFVRLMLRFHLSSHNTRSHSLCPFASIYPYRNKIYIDIICNRTKCHYDMGKNNKWHSYQMWHNVLEQMKCMFSALSRMVWDAPSLNLFIICFSSFTLST